MSYSFEVRAANKAEAKTAVAVELAKVVAQQEVHKVDQAQAQAAADAFIDILPDGDDRHVLVNVAGWVVVREDVVQCATVSVNARFEALVA